MMVDPAAPSICDAKWLKSKSIETLFSALGQGDDNLRVVGGAVRNELLGIPVIDIDFATSLEPDQVMSRAGQANLKSIPTGIDHGTVTVLVDNASFEVTTLRRDVKTDGRHAEVVFGTSWRDDAARRDFTINALYADKYGTIYDPLDEGLVDIKARRVRFIGDPVQRIREDYLRILRFYRFAAQLGVTDLDANAVRASIRAHTGLSLLSSERVWQECKKLFVGENALFAVKALYSSGLLTALLKSVPNITKFAKLIKIEEMLGRPPDALLRLAALTLWHRGDADRLGETLKLSNNQTSLLAKLALPSPLDLTAPENIHQRSHYQLGKTLFLQKFVYDWSGSHLSPTESDPQQLYHSAIIWPDMVLPVTGDDLISSGMKPGPALGKCLRELEAAWLASDMRLTREQLLEKL